MFRATLQGKHAASPAVPWPGVLLGVGGAVDSTETGMSGTPAPVYAARTPALEAEVELLDWESDPAPAFAQFLSM